MMSKIIIILIIVTIFQLDGIISKDIKVRLLYFVNEFESFFLLS